MGAREANMGRSFVSVVMAFVLAMGLTPAFAIEPAAELPAAVQETAPVSEGAAEGADQETNAVASSLESEASEQTGSMVAQEDAAADASSGLVDSDALPSDEARSVIGGSYVYQVDLEQQGESSDVTVTLPNIDALASLGRVDTVSIEATMNYGNVITRSVSAQHTVAELAAAGGSFNLDFADYGKFTVTAKFYRLGKLVQTGDAQTMGVTASSYNIAPVSATLPVTFFSLSLFGNDNIRYDAAGNVVPTVVMMERPNAWNWDNLPEGVYGLPYLTRDQLTNQPSDFSDAGQQFIRYASVMADYVGDLYEMNPSAHFNLYLVDFYTGIIQSTLYANGIPQDQYSITVLSDGSFSYARFNDVYGGDDPAAYHEQLVNQWKNMRTTAYNTGVPYSGGQLWQGINGMTYAALQCEPAAQWWLARPALLETAQDNNVFGKSAQSNPQVVRYYIDRKLASLQASGAEAVQEFKDLYNFSDSYFADAEAAGKDVMLFLGTTVGSEAGSFSDYARFTMAFYGDKFAYYYKGHPGTPTDLYPQKQQELANLGIKDVDSSIAAELILFFYPDIYLSGYQSSTYASLQDPTRAKGLFRTTKADAMQNESYASMEWFMSPVDGNTPEAIRALCGNGTNYLVEFSDAYLATVDYTIAIYNSEANSISYYKQLADGSYELVRSDGGSDPAGSFGVCAIAAGTNPTKVADIAGGSVENGGNVQLYKNNRSFAQRYRFIPDGTGYYTIENVKSGKVLDVQWGGTKAGANVWQYENNGTDAQKWRIVQVDDERYSFISKASGLYLDIASGSNRDGANFQVWNGNDTNAQKFYLKEFGETVKDGTVSELRVGLSDSLVGDIASGSLENGANAQLWERNSTPAQSFRFEFDGRTGSYTIVNEKSGKALDAQWGGTGAGTNVWQYERNGLAAQCWTIEPDKDAHNRDCFAIYASNGDGMVLDVANGQAANGANLQLWIPNNTRAQKWYVG